MPKVFVVEKAFLSTVSKEDKSPQVINTRGGEMHKYMVQFKDQSIPGWIGILKKPGNAVKEGDEMYGVLEENNWGKPQFTRMQLPQDGSVTLKRGGDSQSSSQQTTAPTKSQPAGELEDKIDYLISIVENFLESQGAKKQAASSGNESYQDIDDGPVDLSQLDY